MADQQLDNFKNNFDPEGAVYANPPAAAEGMRRLRLGGVQGFLAGTTRLSTRDTIGIFVFGAGLQRRAGLRLTGWETQALSRAYRNCRQGGMDQTEHKLARVLQGDEYAAYRAALLRALSIAQIA